MVVPAGGSALVTLAWYCVFPGQTKAPRTDWSAKPCPADTWRAHRRPPVRRSQCRFPPRAGAAVCTLHVLLLSLWLFVPLRSLASLHSPTTTWTIGNSKLSQSSNGCLFPWGPKIKWYLVQIGATFALRQLQEAPVAS